MSLTVYTCILGSIGDKLRPPSCKLPGIHLVAFTDQTTPVDGWEIRRPFPMAGLSPRRLARYHKINPHIVLPHHGDSIWLDGSFQLRDSPIDFLSHFQEDIELGCYNHTERRCVYSEYRSCIRLRKDDIGLMTAQVARYREAKYPENAGLTETGIIYRKNCPSVQSFNTLWWAEVAKGSHRDQLSFDYCLWKQSWVCPLKVVRFPGSVYLNPLTAFYRHR